MSRRQIAPGVWQDEAPSSALIRHPESTVPAETIGSMRPLMKSGVYLENRSRTKAPQAFSIHPENRRPLCGAPLRHKGRGWQRWSGETCARILGHADTHRAPDTMAAEATRRRTGHGVSA